MLHDFVSDCLRVLGGPPAFRIYGKGRPERDYHVIDVFATHRRNLDSRWPLWGGTCITLSANVIAVGWDFAEWVVREQAAEPASREHAVTVAGGRLRDLARRLATGGPSFPSASEVLAHECGHTAQARRLGLLYWPIGALVTLCREGPRPWNHFENQASEWGMFGGIVNGSVCERLRPLLAQADGRFAHPDV